MKKSKKIKQTNFSIKPIPAAVLFTLFLGLLIAVFSLSSSQTVSTHAQTASPNPVGQNGEWTMIFNDEFDGPTLDSTKWVTCFDWGTTNGCQSTTTPKMTYRPDNVIVENGIVRLRAQKGTFIGTNGNTYPYSSGMITTANFGGAPFKFTHTYGYMEARIKVPKGQGLWPAFWNLKTGSAWPPEIDVMENLTGGGRTTFTHHMHYHYKDSLGSLQDSGGTWTSPVDLADDYHVYGVSWEKDAIRWYVDGIERRPAFTDSQNITKELMYLILNLQVGGSWPGDPDSTTPFPSYMDIDYVRVWQKNMTTPTLASSPTTIPTTEMITNGTFENGLSSWYLNVTAPATAVVKQATAKVSGTYSAKVTVSTVSPNDWYVQFRQDNLSLVAGKTYTISFWAKAGSNRTINYVLQQIGGAHTMYLNKPITVTKSWKKFTATFTATQSDRVFFGYNLAKNKDSFLFDDVSIKSN